MITDLEARFLRQFQDTSRRRLRLYRKFSRDDRYTIRKYAKWRWLSLGVHRPGFRDQYVRLTPLGERELSQWESHMTGALHNQEPNG